MGTINEISTKELVEELEKREAVELVWINPYEPFQITANGKRVETQVKEGCCTILIVWD